jgi:hypothetical protein
MSLVAMSTPGLVTSKCQPIFVGWVTKMSRMQFPQEFIVLRDVQAIQYFGQNRLEPIPAGEHIFAERPSAYSRMVEAVRGGKQYLVFERDLMERTEPVTMSLDEDPAMDEVSVRQVRAVVRQKHLPSATTQWFPIGSMDAIPALEKLLPAYGERFMVVWEEQEIHPKRPGQAPAKQSG